MFIKAGSFLIPVQDIKEVDVFEIEQGWITVRTEKSHYMISGIDAIDAVMLLKPSALEGKRLKWMKGLSSST